MRNPTFVVRATVVAAAATLLLSCGSSDEGPGSSVDGGSVSGSGGASGGGSPGGGSGGSSGGADAGATGGNAASMDAGAEGDAALGVPSLDTVGSDGGNVTSADGRLVLEIPEGALDDETEITITRIDTGDLPDELDDLGAIVAYQLEPSGLEFAEPAVIRITVDEDEIPSDASGDPVRVWGVFNAEDDGSETLGTFGYAERESGRRTFHGLIEHFSVAGIAPGLSFFLSTTCATTDTEEQEQCSEGPFSGRLVIQSSLNSGLGIAKFFLATVRGTGDVEAAFELSNTTIDSVELGEERNFAASCTAAPGSGTLELKGAVAFWGIRNFYHEAFPDELVDVALTLPIECVEDTPQGEATVTEATLLSNPNSGTTPASPKTDGNDVYYTDLLDSLRQVLQRPVDASSDEVLVTEEDGTPGNGNSTFVDVSDSGDLCVVTSAQNFSVYIGIGTHIEVGQPGALDPWAITTDDLTRLGSMQACSISPSGDAVAGLNEVAGTFAGEIWVAVDGSDPLLLEEDCGCTEIEVLDDGSVLFCTPNSYVAEDTNGVHDCYLVDESGFTLLTLDADGNITAGGCVEAAADASGEHVLLTCDGALVPEDDEGERDLYLLTRSSGAWRRMNLDEAGEPVSDVFSDLDVSSDGQFGTFVGSAGALWGAAQDPTNAQCLIINLQTSEIVLGSADAQGDPTDELCTEPSSSGEGRFIVARSGGVTAFPNPLASQ